jgi:very-short-patch-repair endonuclease
VTLADGRAESVGESRARFLFYSQHLPAPELQYAVVDRFGHLVGRTDFAWPEHRLLGEFDGKVKYERFLRDGERPGDAVFREKLREERLCEVTGWQMVRLVWADLYDARGTAARISRKLRDAA